MNELLRTRIRDRASSSAVDAEQALKETLQEIALYALWQTDFFELALFHGGTSLRLLHGLPRFSEDLDFLAIAPEPHFRWSGYFDALTRVMREFGVKCELKELNPERAVRKALLKDNSIVSQLNLAIVDSRRKLKVKLEIDTHPPAGSGAIWQFAEFPADFEVHTQDLASNFALKLHALLCREYLKGRDWYDFVWYCRQRVVPNSELLRHALQQTGPWRDRDVKPGPTWLTEALEAKVREIDWARAARDVEPFLHASERASLTVWSERFFLAKVKQLSDVP